MNPDQGRVRFDDAAVLAHNLALSISRDGVDVLVVRDILGRFSMVLDDRVSEIGQDRIGEWHDRVASTLRPYAAAQPVVLASTLFMPDEVIGSPRVTTVLETVSPEGAGTIRMLDNTVVGGDWSRVIDPSTRAASRVSRTVLYGFKGGVGRSTATFMLGKHLADQGKCVLVVDLDLESPGSGPMLVEEEKLPQYGLIDQLVESALENAQGLDLVARASRIVPRGNGELWVAPARGRGNGLVPYTYIDKLNRVYVGASGEVNDFASRLEAAVTACEGAVAALSRPPDVVLLDSRAGIHDLAAVAISRLADLALLFGSDSRQTWAGYRDLFRAWREAGQAELVREKLRAVAAMVPDTAQEDYLDSFRDHAWSCFSMLYDDLSDGDLTGYNPSPEDDSAPHSPIPILFTIEMVGMDASSTPGWSDREFIQTAYRTFLNTAGRLITEGR